RYGVELVLQFHCLWIVCGWDTRFIGLTCLVLQVVSLGILDKRNDYLLQQWFGTVVVCVGNEGNPGAVVVLQNLEWTVASLSAVIAQMVSPFRSPLVDHFSLNDVRGGICESFKEVGGWFNDMNYDGIRVRGLNACADNRPGLPICPVSRALNQAQVG